MLAVGPRHRPAVTGERERRHRRLGTPNPSSRSWNGWSQATSRADVEFVGEAAGDERSGLEAFGGRVDLGIDGEVVGGWPGGGWVLVEA